MNLGLKFSENEASELKIGPETEFEDCEFSGINFQNFSLKSAGFNNCTFRNCNLANQDLTNTSFRDIRFESCNLIGINWCNLKRIEFPEFVDSKLNFSSFQSLKIKKTKLLNCSAVDVDFSYCDLTGGQFTNSNLSGTNFNRAILINSDFRSAKNYLFDLRTTNIKGMKLCVAEAVNLLTVLGAEVEF